MNFEYFQIPKLMLNTVTAEKADGKKWGRLSSFHAPFLSYHP